MAKLFESDVTLDNLSRPQLVSMCRYMKIHAFGTDNFLRHQIRSRLDKIRADDKVILGEGVKSLSVPELQMACQSRGIRFTGVSPAALRRELAQWIELHYENKVSGVLLVLSRAFHFNEESADVVKSLEVTLSSLPDKLVRRPLLLLPPRVREPRQRIPLTASPPLLPDAAVRGRARGPRRGRDLPGEARGPPAAARADRGRGRARAGGGARAAREEGGRRPAARGGEGQEGRGAPAGRAGAVRRDGPLARG